MDQNPPVRRTTSRKVKIVEVLAELAIRAGGMGTIFAVALMMAFLFSVAWPLFRGASIEEQSSHAWSQQESQVDYMGLDEEGALAWLLEGEGKLRALQLSNGETYLQEDLFPGREVASISLPLVGETFCFGFTDGSILKADIGFLTEEILEEDFPGGVPAPTKRERVLIEQELFERTERGSLLRTTFHSRLEEPLTSSLTASIVALDRVEASTGEFFALVDEAGKALVLRVRESENLMTGDIDREVQECDLSAVLPKRTTEPSGVLIGTGGTQAFVTYPDGMLVQVSMATFSAPEIVEEVTLVSEGSELQHLGFLPGRSTLIVADSTGAITSWFSVRPPEGGNSRLTRIQEFSTGGSNLEAITYSLRSRMFLAGLESGQITAWQSSLGSEVKSFQIPAGEIIQRLAFHPRQDGVVALTNKGIHQWRVDFAYPEASLSSMFTPVWYEGYSKPEHVWQSSSSSDDFEPKIGMWPLVFGTIKATVFAMLFGAPIAVLAALFTSEYMRRRSKAITKTLVELLAGLPSVVLGFLAALVVAPFVQRHLSQTLTTFVMVPFVLLLGAHLWQLQPTKVRRVRSGWIRLVCILGCPLIAVLLGWGLGPVIESVMFHGDSAAWLDHRVGTAASGWFFLLLPLSACLVFLLFSANRSLSSDGKASLLRFGLGTALTLIVCGCLAFLLQTMGFDARGGVLDTYEQRNALVVGIAVGLVVLPIVYTLTEDALSEVPGNLREASLGAGATQWQTAVRVVLPFATSGIFSALMVGLGRAVGETMIVLMAAGNTPLTEWNVFNGFRTLAANIATEIPEAVVGSAHYRALFFTALILFGMTFVINTFAEIVRRHFRAKVKAL